jgi:hypothetical protein
MSGACSAATESSQRFSSRAASSNAACGSGLLASHASSTVSRSGVKIPPSRAGFRSTLRCNRSCRHHNDVSPPQRLVGTSARNRAQFQRFVDADRLEQAGAGGRRRGDPMPQGTRPQFGDPGGRGLRGRHQPTRVYTGGAQSAVDPGVSGGGVARTVIAEDPHHVGRRGRRLGQTLGAALSQVAGGDARFERIAKAAGEVLDRQTVRNAASAAEFFHGVMPPGRFQHEAPCRVNNQETVVIGEAGALEAARTTLTESGKQFDDRLDRALSGIGPFEGQSHQVHAGEPGGGEFLTREHGLVADGDAVLVGPDFGAPHPVGTTEQHCVSFANLGNLDPGAVEFCALGIRAPRLLIEVLGLVGIAIGVLSEQHSPRPDNRQGIAHSVGRRGRIKLRGLLGRQAT